MSERPDVAYHVQLRQFPHNHARFNIAPRELAAIAERWARGEWIEFGERKWTPHQARLTILEGSPLPDSQLTMGRGWRPAERSGVDVTERVLASASVASGAAGGPSHTAPTSAAPAAAHLGSSSQALALLADSVTIDLLAVLERGDEPLASAWRLAHERLPGAAASDALALAELAVRSLLERALVTLVGDERARGGDSPQPFSVTEAEGVLRAPESWARESDGGRVRLRRT